MPTPGRVTAFHAPGGLGVRVDSALYAGYVVPPYYDSMVAKLIVHAPTRADAIDRLRRALAEFAISRHPDHHSAASADRRGPRRSRPAIIRSTGWSGSSAAHRPAENNSG